MSPDDTNSQDVISIKLTKGYETSIDEQDSDLAQVNWCVSTSSKRKTVYAYRAVPGDNKKKEYLGRVILARKLKEEGMLKGDHLLPGMTCAYLDKDPMNNKRENLVLKTKNIVSKK